MALTFSHYTMTVVLMDNGRKKITKRYQLRDTTVDHAGALTAAAGLITALEAVTDAEILSYTVTDVFEEASYTVPTNPEVQVENNALIVYGIEGELTKQGTLLIPAPKVGLFVGAAGTAQFDIVDGADAAVIAYMALFKETGGTFSISDGEQIADVGAFVSGKRVHRKSTRG